MRSLTTVPVIYLNNIVLLRIAVATSRKIFSVDPAITSIMASVFVEDRLSLLDGIILLLKSGGANLFARFGTPGRHPEAM